MLYNNYEEYMKNVIGSSNIPSNPYRYCNCGSQYGNEYGNTYGSVRNNQYGNQFANQYNNQYGNMYNNPQQINVEQLYPDIYKMINPMVCEMCDLNNEPITEELVDRMTNVIYDNVVNRVEVQNIINVNIETRKADGESSNDKGTCKKENRTTSSIIENRQQNNPSHRPRRNRLLQDLIRILILNRLLRPNRPPFRPGHGFGFGMY